MVDFKLQLEIDHIKKAVSRFSQQMDCRMIEQARKGKRGWDGQLPPDSHIATQMSEDAWHTEHHAVDGVYNETDQGVVVDIANRAMIMWTRHTEVTP